MKLRIRADATHTFLAVNHSLYYPAITFCQEPPFRVSHSLLDSVEEEQMNMQGLLERWQANRIDNETASKPFMEFIAPSTFSATENIEEIKFNGNAKGKFRPFMASTLWYSHT